MQRLVKLHLHYVRPYHHDALDKLQMHLKYLHQYQRLAEGKDTHERN